MPTPAFQRNYVQILEAASHCLEKDLEIPALILIFSLIDSFAWAASAKNDKSTRTRFEAWLQERVYPTNQLTCTATELYAARCGLLHTLTIKADLNARKGVRQLVYAWGPAKLTDLQKSIEVINRTDMVGVHINDLLAAIIVGMVETFKAAEREPELMQRLRVAAALHFSTMPRNSLEKLVDLHDSGKKL